ncbi:MAG: glycosyltransferase [Candidatus Saccharimonas sp.]
MPTQPRIAIVCDFLTVMGGAENVVLAMHEAFPQAPIYTALYDKPTMPAFRNLNVRTTWLQRLPAPLRKTYKLFPTLAVHAFKKLDLSQFDIILTSSYLAANQVRKTHPNQVLISYCHTPARYYWSHYSEYKKAPGIHPLLDPLVRLAMPLLVPLYRKRDYQAAQHVDVFIANSTTVQARIRQYYHKPSIIVHPPVDVARFSPARERGAHYVTSGRQLAYKHHDIAVRACSQLGVPLIVFGNGPMHEKLVAMAGPTIEFRTDRHSNASDTELEACLNTARGFIFPAEEDFGIVSVEALAAGAPVIGFSKGGTTDIVTNSETGVLFDEQTVQATIDAITKAASLQFFPSKLNRTARRFDKSLFITKIRKIVYDNAKD